ncbi:hypothetical protein [Methyloversatilis sp.]|uniref:hypothetical protein n=1 Tax=Methyloversatilis sp. TaxID=2569862 RepID=UPI0027331C0D|nr:hypothetical protein [Methyloversatilis sp.]MDP2868907.1 hypothetical protein [Methyloversatilis sp.]MDP3456406.1 hypothetical protein [Methyloversatilis sp.]MDP3577736.1 hypothetical protein [Methyloversatilis sp.]
MNDAHRFAPLARGLSRGFARRLAHALFALLAACIFPSPGIAAQGDGVRLHDIAWPRSFGYRIGDTLPIQITLEIDDGWIPDRDGLPEVGQGDRQFELRRLDVADASHRCAQCRTYTLEWQLMKSVRAPQTLQLAPTTLRFRKDNQVQAIAVPAFAINAAPLLNWQARTDWINSVHPGYRAQDFDVSAPLLRTAGWTLTAVTLLLAGLWAGGRLGGQGARPFARAWREVRALRLAHGRQGDGDALALAFRALHRGCNETVGRTVFAVGLPDFLRDAPEFDDLADDLAAAFAASRSVFYGLPPSARFARFDDLYTLLGALRDRERLHARHTPTAANAPAPTTAAGH